EAQGQNYCVMNWTDPLKPGWDDGVGTEVLPAVIEVEQGRRGRKWVALDDLNRGSNEPDVDAGATDSEAGADLAWGSVTVAPNPASSSVRLSVTRPSAAPLAWSIISVTGRTVMSGVMRQGGATWDLRDAQGVRVPPGMYFLRLGAQLPVR